MANRHKATGRFASGGATKMPDPEHQRKIEKEAGLKTGGVAKAPKLKTGGKVPALKSGGRLDKFARGGGVGADKNPFSSAKLK